jgi:hypothetical protein
MQTLGSNIFVALVGVAVASALGVLCGRFAYRFQINRLRLEIRSEVYHSIEQEVLGRFEARRTQHVETEGAIFKKSVVVVRDTLYYQNFPTALMAEERVPAGGSVDAETLERISETVATNVQRVAAAISEVASAYSLPSRAGDLIGSCHSRVIKNVVHK